MLMTEQHLWVEKFRPQSIKDCILPDGLKETLQAIVDSGEMHNLLFSGGPGCGKTTAAIAMCKEMGAEYIKINCSEDGNIDTLRTRIRDFATSQSLTGDKKVVILDEFDYANANSFQPALRGFIEEFSINCRFVLTCNFKNRIIEPLHSRCTCVDFRFTKEEQMKMGSQFLKRLEGILESESVHYDGRVIAKLIMRHAPDWRRILNECQRYSASGEIDVGILTEIGDIGIHSLMDILKNKDFSKLRGWVVDNGSNEQAQIYRKIYDSLGENLKPQSVPAVILILANYQYKAAFAADSEINMMACLTEIMMEAEFK
jgi:DNA polymerase III delta prime subunit